jgi:hypothetical protein
LKITYTEEAVADIVEAITFLNERYPTAAAKLDAAITRCVEGSAAKEFDAAHFTSPLGSRRAQLGRAAVPDLLSAAS